MDRLKTLEIFKAVAEKGSFVKGAEGLGISCSVATRAVQDLEESLGARLLQRSSRRVALTPVGQDVLQRASALLEQYRDMEAVSSLTAHEPRGTVRVVAPASYGGPLLGSALAGFRAAHPTISVELRTTDDDADLAEDDADVALCVGREMRLSTIARWTGAATLRLYAAPSYLARRGLPTHPSELRSHDCLTWNGSRQGAGWKLRHLASGVAYLASIEGALQSNSVAAVAGAALHGTGVALLPDVLAADWVRQRRLEPVLLAWQPQPLDVYLAYSSRKHQPLRVRKLVDHLLDAMSALLVLERGVSPRPVARQATVPDQALT